MKSIYILLFCLCSLVTFAQSSTPSTGNHQIPVRPSSSLKKFEHSKRYPVGLSGNKQASTSRSQNIAFYMDYGLLDSFYMVYGPDGGYGSWYRDDEYSFLAVNSGLPVDSVNYVPYAFTMYSRIIDFVNNPVWPYTEYSPNEIQMTIDTVYATTGHVHLSNLNDTITVSIWDYDSFQDFVFDSGAAGGGTVLLGQTQMIVDSSILGGNGEGSTAGEFLLGTYPFSFANNPVVVPRGHRFIIQFNFNGPSEDQFLLGSARRNDCSQICGASTPYINATFGAPSENLDSFNTMYGVRYDASGDSGIFPSTYFFVDCNGDGIKEACENNYVEDLDIFPNIKAVVPQFFVTATPSAQSTCPNSNVNITANGSGSAATPYTYTWTASNGNLSSNSGQQVTLTTGNTIKNDTVIVTLTDANSQSVMDTLVIQSGGIAIDISNTTQPIEINCGASAIITTSISGAILGRNYVWNTGSSGIAASTLTVTQAGNYTVTATNYNGCSATAGVTVGYNGVTNNVSFELPGQIGEHQWSTYNLIFTNTSSSYEAPWVATLYPLGAGSTNTNVSVTDGNPQLSYTYADPGVYNVTLTMDSAGCVFSATQQVTITMPTGIEEVGTNATSVQIFPNPSSDKINITVTGFIPQSLSVYDINGRKLSEQKFTQQIDISALPAGVYFIEVSGGNNLVRNKVVKIGGE